MFRWLATLSQSIPKLYLKSAFGLMLFECYLDSSLKPDIHFSDFIAYNIPNTTKSENLCKKL